MPAHLSMWGKEAGLALYLAMGVTGVRDMGGELDEILEWRQQVAAGALSGPRIVAAGPILDGPTPGWPMRITVRNSTEAREAVANLKKRGVDFIKVHFRVSRDAYFAIADEAKRQGLPFAGHIPLAIRAVEATDAGQSSIEHLNESLLLVDCSREEEAMQAGKLGRDRFVETYDAAKCQALFDRFRKNGTWQTPTLAALRLMATLEEIDPSTDPQMRYVPKKLEALQAATRNAAQFLGKSDSFGTIEGVRPQTWCFSRRTRSPIFATRRGSRRSLPAAG